MDTSRRPAASSRAASLSRGFARPELSLRAAEVASRRERNAAVDAALGEALGAPGAGRRTAIPQSR
jgi:ATP-dependent DNA helicase RecQ